MYRCLCVAYRLTRPGLLRLLASAASNRPPFPSFFWGGFFLGCVLQSIESIARLLVLRRFSAIATRFSKFGTARREGGVVPERFVETQVDFNGLVPWGKPHFYQRLKDWYGCRLNRLVVPICWHPLFFFLFGFPCMYHQLSPQSWQGLPCSSVATAASVNTAYLLKWVVSSSPSAGSG